jgi:predicted nuclease of predicted toxin-antitoxin system
MFGRPCIRGLRVRVKDVLDLLAAHVADCGLRLLQSGPPVVWVRIGNTRRAELLHRLEADFGAIIVALERGELLVEIA